MTKVNRGGSDFVRSERVNWLDQFADSVVKASTITAVEVARNRQQSSSPIYETINSIMMGRSAFSSVDEKVQDMQERTGLKVYLQRVSQEQNKVDKIASEGPFGDLDKSLREDIINYSTNVVRTSRGLGVTVPSLQYDILAQFKKRGLQPDDVNNELVAKLLSDLILNEKKLHPTVDEHHMDLGKGVGVSDTSDDADGSCFFDGLQTTTL